MVKPGGPDLQLSDIQGNILRGYPSSRAAYLFYSFATPEAGRALLGALLARGVRDATDWGKQRPETAVNLAVTFAGLDALDVDPAILALLPDAFRVPMAERATMLDDRGPSGPDQWDAGLGDGTAHLLVTVNQTGKDVEAAFTAFTDDVAEVKAAATAAGAVLTHEQQAEALENRREHFGWADGFGQPAIAGVDTDPVGGSPHKDGSWAFAAPGEFVHGQPDEDGTVTSDPTARLLCNGTFMVYRKLYQDVVAFRARLHAHAVAYGATLTDNPPLTDDQLYELTAAKVVGRWRDGMPIEDGERRPPGEDARLGSKAQKNPSNDFRYSAKTSDLDGHVCPVGAHIRRTNPRDALGWDGGSEMTSTHRIIRRGMPYGTLFADFTPGETDDEIDRGLIFICFNASIERQFEVVQRQWCNDGNAFALGNQKDYILGDHLLDPLTGLPTATTEPDGRRGCPDFSIQRRGHAPFNLDQGPLVVTTKGSEYLLMPGLTVLQQLASGRLDQTRE